MHYWNNPDGDGQSLSDCASDIFDDDLKEGNTPAPEPTPEKKKRPPRKKKKKQTVPLETAEEEDEKDEPVAVEVEDKGESKALAEQVSMQSNETSSSTNQHRTHGQTESMRPQATLNVPNLPQASVSTTNMGINNKATSALNPKAKSWNDAGVSQASTASTASSTAVPRTPWATQTNVAKQQPMPVPSVAAAVNPDMNSSKPVVVDAYKPKPGTWASMAVKKEPAASGPNPSAQSPMLSPFHHAKPQMKQSTISPDWRNHVVSPHRSPYKKTAAQSVGMKNIDSLPPPPVSQPQQTAWPSLDDFGPPLVDKKELSKKTKPIGAWGAKPL
jgi:hypothetical protein